MSYTTIAICSRDPAFTERVMACVSQEQHSLDAMPSQIFWTVAGTSDIEQAYAYALEVDNPNPGGDPTVITDQMILSVVQAIYATGETQVSPAEGTG